MSNSGSLDLHQNTKRRFCRAAFIYPMTSRMPPLEAMMRMQLEGGDTVIVGVKKHYRAFEPQDDHHRQEAKIPKVSMGPLNFTSLEWKSNERFIGAGLPFLYKDGL